MRAMIEWQKMPRGTYRYEHDGLMAHVWQVAGKGWLWAVYAGNTPIEAHKGAYQPTLDVACELALTAMQC